MLNDILEQLFRAVVVSILRKIPEERISQTVTALYNGGVRAVEITLDTPGALRMIEKVKTEFGTKMTVGAGTVLDSETARTAILAGADFILTPTLSTPVIELCNRYGKPAVPGALTPTEILTACEAGAQLVKVFPARVYGPEYLKDLKGPLSQIKLMPVGGVGLENAAEFIRCGAHSLGIGSQMVNYAQVREGRFEEITRTASELMKLVTETKGIT
jgi:2-dehydro-3-deoxyphosphogluconate aldolase/(4S)-4-hydroxy-2-oxoglutarate aldolase